MNQSSSLEKEHENAQQLEMPYVLHVHQRYPVDQEKKLKRNF